MSTVVFNRNENTAPELMDAFTIAEGSENIMAWTARAKMGKAVPQEMQLLSAFLKQHGLNVDEYLENVSIRNDR